MPTHPPSTRRSPARLRLGRDFNRLWIGEAACLLGNATSSVLLPLLAVTHFDAGPGWMGLLTAAAWLPWLLIGLPAGAWVDRLDPRRVMITADLLAAGVLGSVPIAWWLGSLSLTQLLVVALLAGVAAVFYRTAYAKLLPAVVADDALESANARLFGTESVTQVAGPGLAALIVQVMAAAVGVLLDVIGFCVSALCLAGIRTARPDRGSSATERTDSLRRQIGEGVRTVFADRPLRLFMIIGGLSNFGLTGLAALQLLFLVDDLGLSAARLGVLLMIGNVGGLLGAVIAPRLARRLGTGRASTVSFVVAGPAALLIGAPVGAGRVWLAGAGLFLLGAAVVAGNVIRGAWRLRYVPPRLMGRVLTTIQAVNFGTMPLAGLAAGALGARLGVAPALELMAAVHCVACLAVLGTRIGRARSLPAPRSGVDRDCADHAAELRA